MERPPSGWRRNWVGHKSPNYSASLPGSLTAAPAGALRAAGRALRALTGRNAWRNVRVNMARLTGILLLLVAAALLWACDRADGGSVEAKPTLIDARAPDEDGSLAGKQPQEIRAATPSPDPADERPATASPTAPMEGRPPHPATPAPIDEPQPSPDIVGSTSYRWLPGHWIWTGNQYEWQPGVWLYDLPGYALLSAQWLWDGDYWTFRDAGWAMPGTKQAVYRPTALPDGSSTAAPTPDPDESQVELEVRASSYTAYVWTGTWAAPPIVYPSHVGGPGGVSRYARRTRVSDPGTSADPSPADALAPEREEPARSQGTVVQTTPSEEQDAEDEVEYIPGVLHGGKRGEEELRLMQEAQEREAAEQAQGQDAVYVPYYWSYPYYYPARPVHPRPPRPSPLPSRPPHRAPIPRPR
jgi:hypothetical protein